MREIIEFRIPEEHAARFLRPDEGISLGGSVRKYELETSDPRFRQLGQFDRELKAQGRAFFTAWTQRRHYSKGELDTAELFRLKVRSVFEPAGEECGTKYVESTACSKCGAGAKQMSDLILDWKQIPKSKDISRNIAGEIVVSARFVELFRQQGITGAEFRAVRQDPPPSAKSKDWFQLTVQSSEAEIVPPTRAGVDPFDDDAKGECRCPQGDLIGLTLLSEVSVKSATRGHADIVCTRQFIGARRGLLRPERIILVSGKVRLLLESEKLKGWEIEIAHLV
jgi:hypothetical protein